MSIYLFAIMMNFYVALLMKICHNIMLHFYRKSSLSMHHQRIEMIAAMAAELETWIEEKLAPLAR